jgi:hypothetical protein
MHWYQNMLANAPVHSHTPLRTMTFMVNATSYGIDHMRRRLHARTHPRRWRTTRLDAPITINAVMVRELLVPVHGHALAVPAKLTVGRGRDGAAGMALVGALLEGKQLLGAEGFVVDLCGRLDQVLQVGAGEEVAEVDEFAVVLVLDCGALVKLWKGRWGWHTVDDAPLVLAATDVPAINNDGPL